MRLARYVPIITALSLPVLVAWHGYLLAAAILAIPAIGVAPPIRDRNHADYGSFLGGIALTAGYLFWLVLAAAIVASIIPEEPDHKTWLESQHKKFGLD